MSDTTKMLPHNLTVDDWIRVNDICEKFGKDLKAGRSISIDDVLDAEPERLQDSLRGALEDVRNHAGNTPPKTIWRFLKNLILSRVLSIHDLRNLLDPHPQQRPQTVADLRELLIRPDWLTKYQADQIEAGQTQQLVFGTGDRGKYVVLEEIGKGAMGTVFKARHRELGREVALKVLKFEVIVKDELAVVRFKRERTAIARLSHQNIVTARDAEQSGDVYFLAMDLIHGHDLEFLLLNLETPLPVDWAIDFLLQAADGLAHAHDNGVLHRDIKPSNLMVDAKGQLKIADFGIALLNDGGIANKQITFPGTFMGTPDYAPPEQLINAHEIDGRADIYSLGCTLYFLLTGKSPYTPDGDAKLNLAQVITAHQEKPIPSLRAARPEVPEPLETLFQAMLAKKPEDRPAMMNDVVSQLKRLHVPPVSPPPRIKPKPPDSSHSSNKADGASGIPNYPQTVHTKLDPTSLGASQIEVPAIVKSVPEPRVLVIQPQSPADKLAEAKRAKADRAAVIAAAEQKRAAAEQKRIEEEKAAAAAAKIAADKAAEEARLRREQWIKQARQKLKQWYDEGEYLGAWSVAAFLQRLLPGDSESAEKIKELDELGENVLGMRLAYIPAGEFLMGSPEKEKERGDSENQHPVRISRDFLIGMHPVTQANYAKLIGRNPSSFKTGAEAARRPVECVSWFDAIEFCNKLSEAEGKPPYYTLTDIKRTDDGSIQSATVAIADGEGTGYRLPTEAEWEYAARAGTTTRFFHGDNAASLGEFAWYNANSRSSTHPVGQKKPNAWGLYDPAGNVWEWCFDTYDAAFYRQASELVVDPVNYGPAGSSRVLRGGGWNYDPIFCLAAARNYKDPAAPWHRYRFSCGGV